MTSDIDDVLSEHYFRTAMDSVRDLIDHGSESGGTASHYSPRLTQDIFDPTVEYGDHDVKRWARQLHNVHSVTRCAGRACTVHRPSPHHMRSWPITWRDDQQSFERICVCGIGHPDPDQLDFWRLSGLIWRAVHSCDGCCHS